ncbi:MAG: CHASE domain-containing protein, partial [Defluviitaleaceae bacterium]|nr:CHASE domain-containing protein [Defluviitaleaceae bacterium]
MNKSSYISIYKRISYRTVVIFLFTLGMCLSLVLVIISNRSNVETLTMEQLISEKSGRVNDVMMRLLLRTETLASYIRHNNGIVQDFDLLASMLADDPSIINMLIAPGGVVSDIYPLEDNSAVIGLDFFTEGAGNAEAIMAKQTRQLVLGGPFMGVQGRTILVGRLSVFLHDENGQEYFWGLVSVTLAYPEALEGAGLNELRILGFDYDIWRTNPDTGERQTIVNSEREHRGNVHYVERSIALMNAEWHFRILSVNRWYNFAETWISIAVSICVSLLAAAVMQNYQDLKRLKNLHDQSVLEKHMVGMKLLVSSLEHQDMVTQHHRRDAALFRHDLRHVGSLVLSCLDEGDIDGARKLVVDIDADIRKIEKAETVREITRHRLIDAALCHAMDACEDDGIDLEIKMQSIEDIKVDFTELAVTIANALENAV